MDYNYIKNLDLPTAKRENKTNEKGNLTYNDFKEIGKIVAKKAKSIFENELGVKIYKDMPNLMVLTSAGYVMLNEQSTEACWDGLFEVLGSRLSRLTLLPDHKAFFFCSHSCCGCGLPCSPCSPSAAVQPVAAAVPTVASRTSAHL